MVVVDIARVAAGRPCPRARVSPLASDRPKRIRSWACEGPCLTGTSGKPQLGTSPGGRWADPISREGKATLKEDNRHRWRGTTTPPPGVGQMQPDRKTKGEEATRCSTLVLEKVRTHRKKEPIKPEWRHLSPPALKAPGAQKWPFSKEICLGQQATGVQN